jgi:hypothetical protein
MDYENLTIKQAKELSKMFDKNNGDSFFEVGKWPGEKFMFDTGRVVAINAQEILLEDATWIAESWSWSGSVE